MASNGVSNGVSAGKHYNEGTFLFTVSLPPGSEPVMLNRC